MATLGPSPTIPLLFLAGVVASMGAHQARLWLGRRRDLLHLWVAVWCALTLLVLASHHLQTVAETAEWAELGARLAWMSLLLPIAVLIGLRHALAGRPLPRGLLAGLVGADLAVVAFVWLGDAFFKADVYRRTDGLGATYWAQTSSSFVSALVACLFAVVAYCVATLWRARAVPSGERRAVLANFGVYIALAINDLLHAAGVIQSVRLFGVVPVGTELPLHGSYSGTVARTGEVFFSADTPSDPNNFLAAEDRAAGIATYLGLPIKARDRLFSHSICPDCRDGVVKDQLDRWRGSL